MSERVPAALRRIVTQRAMNACEYCGMPDNLLRLPHEPDHIIATQHGGETVADNLAYTCSRCNRLKGPNLTSIDTQTGAIAPLFNPRTDIWSRHFRWEEGEIVPLTPIGRATASLLQLNEPERVGTRTNLIQQGRYPFVNRQKTVT